MLVTDEIGDRRYNMWDSRASTRIWWLRCYVNNYKSEDSVGKSHTVRMMTSDISIHKINCPNTQQQLYIFLPL